MDNILTESGERILISTGSYLLIESAPDPSNPEVDVNGTDCLLYENGVRIGLENGGLLLEELATVSPNSPVRRFNVGNIVFVKSSISRSKYLQQKIRAIVYSSQIEAYYDLGLGVYSDSKILSSEEYAIARCGRLLNKCAAVR